jgi:hypothetical protein
LHFCEEMETGVQRVRIAHIALNCFNCGGFAILSKSIEGRYRPFWTPWPRPLHTVSPEEGAISLFGPADFPCCQRFHAILCRIDHQDMRSCPSMVAVYAPKFSVLFDPRNRSQGGFIRSIPTAAENQGLIFHRSDVHDKRIQVAHLKNRSFSQDVTTDGHRSEGAQCFLESRSRKMANYCD